MGVDFLPKFDAFLPPIDEDATVTVDDKLLARKIGALLKDSYTTRIGGGQFTGEFLFWECN